MTKRHLKPVMRVATFSIVYRLCQMRSWLCISPEPDPIFTNTAVIQNRYSKWFSVIGQLPDRLNLMETYCALLTQHNLAYPNDYRSITDDRSRTIREDLNRTLGSLRGQFQDTSEAAEECFPIYSAILRVIMSLDCDNPRFRYRQGMIDIFCPVFHVVWCYATVIETYPLLEIEAISRFLFCEIMTKTGHIDAIPGGSPGFNRAVIPIKLKELAPAPCQILISREIDQHFFIPLKWFLLLFTQDLKFGQVLEVWDFCIGSSLEEFEERLYLVCANILTKAADRFENGPDEEYLAGLRNPGWVQVNEICVAPRGIWGATFDFLWKWAAWAFGGE
jgi:hypothetical protein